MLDVFDLCFSCSSKPRDLIVNLTKMQSLHKQVVFSIKDMKTNSNNIFIMLFQITKYVRNKCRHNQQNEI